MQPEVMMTSKRTSKGHRAGKLPGTAPHWHHTNKHTNQAWKTPQKLTEEDPGDAEKETVGVDGLYERQRLIIPNTILGNTHMAVARENSSIKSMTSRWPGVQS